ncbi:MAG: hypothetical protein ABIH85_04555 [Candidatus Omnitrophota bacterium]|nr:hypothetical protein [Candidatus Omnitrophota bacterium]MBU1894441.1 hypothetical protein [Candidatus Omnitrophota bacterium]
MEKIKCEKCGSVGYTASPLFVRCDKCGGRHKVISMNKKHSIPVKVNRELWLVEKNQEHYFGGVK